MHRAVVVVRLPHQVAGLVRCLSRPIQAQTLSSTTNGAEQRTEPAQTTDTIPIRPIEQGEVVVDLFLMREVRELPPAELQLLSSTLCEHFNLPSFSIDVKKNQDIRKSVRQERLVIQFLTEEGMQLWNEIFAKENQVAQHTFINVVHETLRVYCERATLPNLRLTISVTANISNDASEANMNTSRQLLMQMELLFKNRKYYECVTVYRALRTQFGIEPTAEHATIFMAANTASGRFLSAEMEFRYWIRIYSQRTKRLLYLRRKDKFAKHGHVLPPAVEAALQLESIPRLPKRMMDIMERMYIDRGMLEYALRIFYLRRFRRPSSYDALIALAARQGEVDVALKLFKQWAAWRIRAVKLSQLRQRRVYFSRPSGKTVSNVMLALCRAGRVRDAAQLLVDSESRAQTDIAAKPKWKPERISANYVSDECYGILLFYLNAPERCEEFLGRMSNISIRPTAKFYNWQLRTIRMGKSFTEAHIVTLLQNMVDWSAAPNEGTYSELMQYYESQGNHVKVKALASQMQESSVKIMDPDTMLPLLRSILATDPDENWAVDVFDHIVLYRKLPPTPSIQEQVMRILIRSAENAHAASGSGAEQATGSPYSRAVSFFHLLARWRDRFGSKMAPKVLLELVESLGRRKLIHEIDRIVDFLFKRKIFPPPELRAVLVHICASMNAMNLALHYWNELTLGFSLPVDADSIVSLVEAASSSGHVIPVMYIVLKQTYTDAQTAKAVGDALVKSHISTRADSAPQLQSLAKEWESICKHPEFDFLTLVSVVQKMAETILSAQQKAQ